MIKWRIYGCPRRLAFNKENKQAPKDCTDTTVNVDKMNAKTDSGDMLKTLKVWWDEFGISTEKCRNREKFWICVWKCLQCVANRACSHDKGGVRKVVHPTHVPPYAQGWQTQIEKSVAFVISNHLTWTPCSGEFTKTHFHKTERRLRPCLRTMMIVMLGGDCHSIQNNSEVTFSEKKSKVFLLQLNQQNLQNF